MLANRLLTSASCVVLSGARASGTATDVLPVARRFDRPVKANVSNPSASNLPDRHLCACLTNADTDTTLKHGRPFRTRPYSGSALR